MLYWLQLVMSETKKDALDLADNVATTAGAKQSVGSAGRTSSPLLASLYFVQYSQNETGRYLWE